MRSRRLEGQCTTSEGGGEGSLPFAAVSHGCHRDPGGLADNSEVEFHSCAFWVNTRSISTLVVYIEDSIGCNISPIMHI